MNAYLVGCLVVTVIAVALRKHMVVRVLAVGVLLWIGYLQRLDVQQVERMVGAATPGKVIERPESVVHDLGNVMRRDTNQAGFIPFLCAGILALVPVRPVRPAPATSDSPD